mmetsp:Transcript_1519/g.2275  ORF Transcript_1519/g.2275 Transcript_1519/m.2275 type:complete len:476 (-) Transcript_1519:295-1722(-)
MRKTHTHTHARTHVYSSIIRLATPTSNLEATIQNTFINGHVVFDFEPATSIARPFVHQSPPKSFRMGRGSVFKRKPKMNTSMPQQSRVKWRDQKIMKSIVIKSGCHYGEFKSGSRPHTPILRGGSGVAATSSSFASEPAAPKAAVRPSTPKDSVKVSSKWKPPTLNIQSPEIKRIRDFSHNNSNCHPFEPRMKRVQTPMQIKSRSFTPMRKKQLQPISLTPEFDQSDKQSSSSPVVSMTNLTPPPLFIDEGVMVEGDRVTEIEPVRPSTPFSLKTYADRAARAINDRSPRTQIPLSARYSARNSSRRPSRSRMTMSWELKPSSNKSIESKPIRKKPTTTEKIRYSSSELSKMTEATNGSMSPSLLRLKYSKVHRNDLAPRLTPQSGRRAQVRCRSRIAPMNSRMAIRIDQTDVHSSEMGFPSGTSFSLTSARLGGVQSRKNGGGSGISARKISSVHGSGKKGRQRLGFAFRSPRK